MPLEEVWSRKKEEQTLSVKERGKDGFGK